MSVSVPTVQTMKDHNGSATVAALCANGATGAEQSTSLPFLCHLNYFHRRRIPVFE